MCRYLAAGSQGRSVFTTWTGTGWGSSTILVFTSTCSNSHETGPCTSPCCLGFEVYWLTQRYLGRVCTCLYHWSSTGPVYSAFVGLRKDKIQKQIVAAWNSSTARPGYGAKQPLFHVDSTASWQRSFCTDSRLWSWLWFAFHHLPKQSSPGLWAAAGCRHGVAWAVPMLLPAQASAHSWAWCLCISSLFFNWSSLKETKWKEEREFSELGNYSIFWIVWKRSWNYSSTVLCRIGQLE